MTLSTDQLHDEYETRWHDAEREASEAMCRYAVRLERRRIIRKYAGLIAFLLAVAWVIEMVTR